MLWFAEQNTQTHKKTKRKVDSTQGAQYFLLSVYQLSPPTEGLYTSRGPNISLCTRNSQRICRLLEAFDISKVQTAVINRLEGNKTAEQKDHFILNIKSS